MSFAPNIDTPRAQSYLHPAHAYPTSPTSSINSVHPVNAPPFHFQWTPKDSIFNASSAVTSVASSVAATPLELSNPPTTVIPQLSTQTILEPRNAPRRAVTSQPCGHPDASLLVTTPVPAEQRLHPRRTVARAVTSIGVPSVEAQSAQAPPVPTLQRQADRKVNFVENLVDSAAQIVETIWHLPRNRPPPPPRDILPLRTFIQETLRRSRTSYSTLQVALYYLIVIRPRLPGQEYDTSHLEGKELDIVKAKQCGRRMFLAALILASKYLQDRNYSARAWSKISGLPTNEINVNELAFLEAIDWRLHISEVVYQRWTDLVLKYTSAPSPSPVSPTRSSPWKDDFTRKQEWCDIVMRLSPDLREVDEILGRVPTPMLPPPTRLLSPALTNGTLSPSPHRAMAAVVGSLTRSVSSPTFRPPPPRPTNFNTIRHNSTLSAIQTASPVPTPLSPSCASTTCPSPRAENAAHILGTMHTNPSSGSVGARKRSAPSSTSVTPNMQRMAMSPHVATSPRAEGERKRVCGRAGDRVAQGVVAQNMQRIPISPRIAMSPLMMSPRIAASPRLQGQRDRFCRRAGELGLGGERVAQGVR